ncbi:uncharacterized protein PV09_07300 [Verruconis gallopava]|uniref:RBR-type E3 ubiquitin transferase n=1 Tax=Verruconis gallopava TaxID=253628 RepID=A0A0D1XGD2_9PEZI|nr:uncharacterized protein PV09_07300 [Verruconis gallopava]KIW01261.1 hypothetical protein PV09_07300 [Verruconis gallopava]
MGILGRFSGLMVAASMGRPIESPSDRTYKPSFLKAANNSDLRDQIDSLNYDLVRATRKLRRAQRKVASRSREVDQLRSEVARLNRLCKSRKYNLEEQKEELRELRRTLRMRDAKIGEQNILLDELKETVVQYNRQILEADFRHQAELSELREVMNDLEARRNNLIQKLGNEISGWERQFADLETNWHTIARAGDALAVATQFHEQLARNLYIRWRGPKSTDLAPKEKNVIFCQMDQYPFRVPLMARFLPWSETPKTCNICAGDYHELNIVSIEHWKQACRGFEGRWMKDIFSFPDSDELLCDHPMDVCKACIQHQIHTQLETLGSRGWNKLSCPFCARTLSHAEIQRFAAKEDFEKYEQYYLLEVLSKEPGFRWCLSGSCKSGQLYEPSPYMHTRIHCKVCDFAMCFYHQMPWHVGLTCAEYERKLAHGVEEEKSEEWKKKNTKPCPGRGCGRPIVKGGGCFHMTCSLCRHEFCWECLADWHSVMMSSANHKEGCYFRTSSRGPMNMMGVTIEVALRGM